MIPLEICLEADTSHLEYNLEQVHRCGVARVELCANMAEEGLTPSAQAITQARSIFKNGELLVMIRPRGGHFCYSATECQTMASSIDMAADLGADGVVLGVLDHTLALQRRASARLINRARKQRLSVTFHRAFDAINNPLESMRTLVDMGVSRVLTSGTPWESRLGAVDGLNLLGKLLAITNGYAELVVGGGVTTENARTIITSLNNNTRCENHGTHTDFSLHCYSSVLSNGMINKDKLSRIFNSCRSTFEENR